MVFVDCEFCCGLRAPGFARSDSSGPTSVLRRRRYSIFSEAFNRGWFVSLFRTQAGYFQTFPRIACAIALLVPLPQAPLLTNLIGLCIQALPVAILLSSRLAGLGSLSFRTSLALIYVALPNCREIHASVTQTQWHLPLSAFLLLIASVPSGRLSRLFDSTTYLACGLSGPFCVFLSPIAGLLAWRKKEPRRWLPVGVFAACAVIQAAALVFSGPTARDWHYRLGANWADLVRIVSGNVYFASLIGANALASLLPLSLLALVAGIGSVLLALWLTKSSLEFRLFAALCTLLLAVSLCTPAIPVGKGETAWECLKHAGPLRYWFFPTLLIAWMPVWFAFNPNNETFLRRLGYVLVLCMSFGILKDWRYKPYSETRFSDSLAKYNSAPKGAFVILPEHPDGWYFTLIKQ